MEQPSSPSRPTSAAAIIRDSAGRIIDAVFPLSIVEPRSDGIHDGALYGPKPKPKPDFVQEDDEGWRPL